ncbi:death-associated inhibitor of apoptosis 1-like isoform X1 [Trichogramma pretiosum]|uniref:death-associated inhibitor of apoptosis 1-like isoform X1 n=2 Tax=Trichogramma pretiosum TaxID=7493 RepID=UPI0006C9D420|nr:death-associated inhibitor of apoptosis 1-like isoform X1 [Trichogramma pretiosum]
MCLLLPFDSNTLSHRMAGMLDQRGNPFLSDYKFKQNLTPRAPTPPQLEENEVDDAGNMDFRFEEVRLQSYENWPSPYVRPSDLAAAGFYYTKEIDRVRCFECSTEVCRWEDGDDPMVEHQRWGGRCRFIRKLPCGNVPLGADASMIPARPSRSWDVCGPYRLDYRHSAEADTHGSSSGPTSTSTQLPSAARLGCLGIGIAKRPDFPDYASYEARLQTFADWPTSIAQTKEQLADAGFFYTGTGDQTTCYHCGGGLKNWEPQDDPWVQHAKWFSTCFYVRLVKGQEFINSVTGKHIPPLSEEETMKLNLPSCIKKVECLSTQKCESKEETQQPAQTQLQPSAAEPATATAAAAESAAGPSTNEVEPQAPTPAPRSSSTTATTTTTEMQTETQAVPSSNQSQQSALAQQAQKANNEKKSIDDARVCKICYNEELGVVFLPCGHMVACVKCAPGMTTCAVCRETVTMTVRAFFS